MRRSAVIALLVLGALAAPSQAATKDVSVANTAFTPATVQIAPGDTVRWTFAGPDLNHSTTSDAGQAEGWESDPGNPSPFHVVGATFSHTFNTAGTYGYFCRVHTFMRGTVRVAAPGSEPADTVAPVFASPRVSVRRRRATFKVDEAATVQAKLRGPTRRTFSFPAEPGTNVLALPRMAAGRYALTLKASDAAGNAAKPVSLKFAVPKRR
jgi:plastocyanin